jgi:hypothetical protein
MPDYGPLYQAAGTQWNVAPLLLQSMAMEESSENPAAVGPVIRRGPAQGQQARGLMQFIPETAATYGVDVTDPTSSVYGAANYMRQLLDQHRGDTRAALAAYNGSHPDSDYVNQVMDRYSQLNSAWGLGAGNKNFKTPPQTPNYFTAENQYSPASPTRGQQAQTAPPTETAPASGGVVTFAPHVEEDGAPPAAAPPGTAAAAPAAGVTFHSQVEEEGGVSTPGRPPPGQQYMSSATSPGALATGTPIAEGRVPGPLFQAAINTPTDPLQRAHVAAAQLGIPVDRILLGPRMAAVGDDGRPYYIEPEPVSAYHTPQTRPGPPGTPWEEAPGSINPYQRPFVPLEAGSSTSRTPENLLRAGGAMLPGGIQNSLTMVPALLAEAAGGPVAGAAVYGGATALADIERQGIANWLDPRPGGLPLLTGDTARDAAIAAGTWFLPSVATRAGQASTGPLADAVGFGRGRLEGIRTQPLGMQDRLAPWEAPQRWELPPTPPPGTPAPPPSPTPPPSMPVPGAARGAAGTPAASQVHLNPLGEAADTTGPYAATSAAEARANAVAIDTLPPQRMPLLTQPQIEARADQIYRHFAANGNLEADMRELVPGSPHTMGGRTGNAGLNSLERWLRNEPELKNIFDAIDARQHGARADFTRRLIGDADALEQLQAARSTQTSSLREAAFRGKAPTDPSAAVADIDRVMAGPEGKREGVAGPLRRIRQAFYDADGNLETDPEILYGVRKNITDALSPLARGTERDASTASHLLQGVLRHVDTAIEAGAPGFRAYMDAYSQASRPIDAMEYLLRRNMTDATGGVPTLAKVDLTIKDIERRRLMPGASDAKSVSDEQLAGLHALRDDLRRSANLAKGKPLGSNTADNFAGGALLNRLTGPIAGAVGRGIGAVTMSWPGYLMAHAGEHAVRGTMGGINQSAQVRLKEALLRRVFNEGGAGERALGAPGRAPPPMPPGPLSPPGPPMPPPAAPPPPGPPVAGPPTAGWAAP